MSLDGGAWRVEVLAAPEHLASRAEDWDRLAAGTDSPFLTSAWLLAWWRTSHEAVRCHILRDTGGHLRAGGLIVSGRTGTVSGAADVHSGDWGIVAADDAARTAMWTHLAGLARPVPRLLLPALDEPMLLAARRALEALGHRLVVLDQRDSPTLALPSTYSEVLAAVSKQLRGQLTRSRRKLESSGAVQLRTTTGGDRLEEDLEAFLRLEASGWKGRAGTAILSAPRTAALYRQFARSAATTGALRLHLLHVDAAVIAGDLSCRVGDRTSLIKTAFDERYAQYQPGLVLRGEVMRASVDEGVREYDFLGGPDAYKLRWTDAYRPRSTVLAVRGACRPEAVLRERVRPVLGRWRRRLAGRTNLAP